MRCPRCGELLVASEVAPAAASAIKWALPAWAGPAVLGGSAIVLAAVVAYVMFRPSVDASTNVANTPTAAVLPQPAPPVAAEPSEPPAAVVAVDLDRAGAAAYAQGNFSDALAQ